VAADERGRALHRGLRIGLVVLVDELDRTPQDPPCRIDLRQRQIEAELGLVAEQLEAAGEGLDSADAQRIGREDRRHRQRRRQGAGGDARARLDERAP
jgi:hypothetical protein